MDPTWKPAEGSGAALVHELSLTMYVACGLIFVFVMALLLYAVFSPARPIRERRWLAGGGLVFPGTVLSALLLYSLAVSNALGNFQGEGALRFLLDCVSSVSRSLGVSAGDGDLRIEVNARQWWWEVRYSGSGKKFELANEIHVPVGRTVEVELITEDVIHSFWVPSLAGKVDMLPGRTNRLVIRTSEPGIYRGQCAEYCGGQHALMALYVIAEPREAFDAWLERQARPVEVPQDGHLRAGYDAFFKGRCAECHSVRGTPADGVDGPDLTHIGGRHSLAAGTLRNHIGTMAGWIAGSQDIKPGNPMPDSEVYSGRELRALSAWLESLE